MQKPDSLEHDIIEVGAPPTSTELEVAVCLAIQQEVLYARPPIGVLLSGGVDSAFLLYYVKMFDHRVRTFTIAGSEGHPDYVAAQRLAELWKVEHHGYVPTAREVSVAHQVVTSRDAHYPGDEGVLLALDQAARHGVKTILATDGIDELMGGYWYHANDGIGGMSSGHAFNHYWRVLWDQHLYPLFCSADMCGMEVVLPYLAEEVVSLAVRLPLAVRAPNRQPKAFWKDIAARRVPPWVAERRKVGFCDWQRELVGVAI